MNGERGGGGGPSPTGWPGISHGEAFGAIFVSRRQRETAECVSVGKLTTSDHQPAAHFVPAAPPHPLSKAPAYVHN